MIALAGTVEVMNNYYNFYATNKIVDGEIKELNTDDKELIKSEYNNINIDYTAVDDTDDNIKTRIKEFSEKLLKEKRFVCVFYLYREDIFSYKDGSGHEGKRVLLSKLFEYSENDDIFYGIVKVITRNKIEEYRKTDEFITTDYEILVKTKEIKLFEREQYFLQYSENSEFKYVGPIGFQNKELKKPREYPVENLKIIEGKAIKEIHGNNLDSCSYYIYYTGKDFDFDFVPPPVIGGGDPDPIEEKRKELISDINNYRNYGNDMICNMLICITQGFLTIFAGEPGTGKTSICDKLAQVLGASRKPIAENSDEENRYLSISVERGWTSKNDLIGYLNPLNGDVVDTTGLQKALETVNGEKEEKASPYIVLLDEANLSQMEYYWSSFIKLADDDARRKTPLYFSEAINYMITDWFKFLATINNDQTTESLSPRLLDRAWVITLPSQNELGGDNHQDDDCERISWDELQRMFAGISENTDLFKNAKEQLKKIYDKYEEGDKPVSPRSKKAIEAYLKSALSCFEGNSDEEKINNVIDFILIQRLLPMLNGYISNNFKKSLEELIAEEKYPRSYRGFEKMCKQDDYTNSTYVNFFM